MRRAGRPRLTAANHRKPLVIAHRGASHDAPESTASAYRLACARGADALEADLQLTADGHIVIHHDADLARTTNVATRFPDRATAPTLAFTLAELQSLDAGAWFNTAHPDRARPDFAGQRLLVLNNLIDIAETAPHRPLLYLETKDPDRQPTLEQHLAKTLRRRNWTHRAIVESFDPASLTRLAAALPDTPRALLLAPGGPSHTEALAIARRLGCRAINPAAELATPAMITAAHAASLAVHAWTVNLPEIAATLTASGVDGMFTDRC